MSSPDESYTVLKAVRDLNAMRPSIHVETEAAFGSLPSEMVIHIPLNDADEELIRQMRALFAPA